MREKESQAKDGYPNVPAHHGVCALCGDRALSYQQPILCAKHMFESADCAGCPGNDCRMCRDYAVTVSRKFIHGGWRP